MKKRLLALLLALALLLSGCEKTPAADSAPPDPSATPAPSAPASPTPEPSEPASPEPSAPAPASSAGVTPDYSAHAAAYEDEESYRTVQADLGKLSRGEKALALEEGPADWSALQYHPRKDEIWGYDMSSCDMSGKDLRVIKDWNDISFNSDTVWPAADKLPEGFDPEAVLELGKDPGLGIRKLHERGVTGEGVGVAIIDQRLYTGHEQYRDNLMLYETLHAVDKEVDIHGPAVSSIAVGKDMGVAPGAKLYFIACDFGHYTGDGGFEYDLSIMADAIYRVLEINRSLPEGEKIRVISVSLGASPMMPGFAEMKTAVRAALEEGILVLTVDTEQFYDFSFCGMCRRGLDDPNDPTAYSPATWLLDADPQQLTVADDEVLVPMGGRAFAACVGEADYEWCYVGGMSWAVPWMAGFYALCCQADPECTPERFFEAVKGAATVEMVYGPAKTFFGRVVDPAAAIERLQNG